MVVAVSATTVTSLAISPENVPRGGVGVGAVAAQMTGNATTVDRRATFPPTALRVVPEGVEVVEVVIAAHVTSKS